MGVRRNCDKGGAKSFMDDLIGVHYLSGAPPSVGAELTINFGPYKPSRWPETTLGECSKRHVPSPETGISFFRIFNVKNC